MLQPVTLSNLRSRAIRCDERRRRPDVQQSLGDVRAGYSHGISGWDGWGCEISSAMARQWI